MIFRALAAPKRSSPILSTRHILAIQDVPDYFELSDIQSRQVQCAKSGREVVDPDAIETLLSSYQFPLTFFDYETYPAAIPRFRGYGPFDQVPFQFSLDVLTTPDGEVRHFEFLDTAPGAPDPRVIEALASVGEVTIPPFVGRRSNLVRRIENGSVEPFPAMRVSRTSTRQRGIGTPAS
jgi:Domain of unknown function(DUF2779)